MDRQINSRTTMTEAVDFAPPLSPQQRHDDRYSVSKYFA